MKQFTVPCNDRGHITVVLVLQSCTDPLYIPPGSSNETFVTSSDGTCNIIGIDIDDIDEDVHVIEEGNIAVNRHADTGIKQEEVPNYITFPDIRSEPDEVSYLCVGV
jgi:hypothetical protein